MNRPGIHISQPALLKARWAQVSLFPSLSRRKKPELQKQLTQLFEYIGVYI